MLPVNCYLNCWLFAVKPQEYLTFFQSNFPVKWEGPVKIIEIRDPKLFESDLSSSRKNNSNSTSLTPYQKAIIHLNNDASIIQRINTRYQQPQQSQNTVNGTSSKSKVNTTTHQHHKQCTIILSSDVHWSWPLWTLDASSLLF